MEMDLIGWLTVMINRIYKGWIRMEMDYRPVMATVMITIQLFNYRSRW